MQEELKEEHSGEMKEDRIKDTEVTKIETKENISEEHSAESCSDPNCSHGHGEQHSHQRPQPRLSNKEINSLIKNKYQENKGKFKNSYVILNKKTGMIVELKAVSSMHACNMIGWRPQNCKLLRTINPDENKAALQPPQPPVEEVEIVEVKSDVQN